MPVIPSRPMAKKKPARRYGPVPSGAKLRSVKLTDEDWKSLATIARQEKLGDGRGGRTDAIQWLIRAYMEGLLR